MVDSVVIHRLEQQEHKITIVFGVVPLLIRSISILSITVYVITIRTRRPISSKEPATWDVLLNSWQSIEAYAGISRPAWQCSRMP